MATTEPERIPVELAPRDRLELARLVSLLELHRGRGGIYILAGTAEQLLLAEDFLLARLPGMQLCPVEDADPLQWAARQAAAGPARDTLFRVDLAALDEADTEQRLRALNYRREAVPDAGLQLLVSTAPERLGRISADAKDFWSFRTDLVRLLPPPPALTAQSETARRLSTDIERAETRLRELLAEESGPGHDGRLAQAYRRCADLYLRAGRVGVRIEALRHAAAAFARHGDTHSEWDVRIGLADAFRDGGRLEEARDELRRLEGLIEKPSSVQRGDLQAACGDFYDATGDTEQARRSYRVALESARSAEDRGREASLLLGIANTEIPAGSYQAALTAARGALRLYEELGHFEGETLARGRFGNALGFLGRLRQAVTEKEAALRAWESSRTQLGVIVERLGLGNIHRRLGELGRSREYLEAGLEAAVAGGIVPIELKARRMLANLELEQGRPEKALLQARRGEALAEAWAWEKAWVLELLAEVHLDLEAPAEAAEFAHQTLDFSEEAGFQAQRIAALRILAECRLAQGELVSAREHAEGAQAAAKDSESPLDRADALATLGRVELAQGDTEAAKAHLEAALSLEREMGRLLHQARRLDDLSRLAAGMGDQDAARRDAHEARTIRVAMGLEPEGRTDPADLPDSDLQPRIISQPAEG